MPQRFGQHWLIDRRVCERIAAAVDLQAGETCIEVGGGKGALTRRLARNSERLIVYELDRNWAEHLRVYAPQWGGAAARIEVREQDALRVEWTREGLGLLQKEPVVVTGNLPYYIATPLLLRLAHGGLDFERALFLVQKEVADKIAAEPGDSNYGRLTVSLGAFLKCEVLFDVPPEAFKPRPKVTSSLLKLTRLPEPLVSREEIPAFEMVVQVAFHMRRKTVRNNLKSGFQGLRVETLNAILRELGIEEKSRAQELSVGTFARLARRLVEERGGISVEGSA